LVSNVDVLSISVLDVFSEGFSSNDVNDGVSSFDGIDSTSSVAVVVFSVELSLDFWD